MSFLNALTDFNLPPYTIPNVEDNESLPDYIEREEDEILESLLGSSFFTSFNEGLADLPLVWDADQAYVTGNRVTYGNETWAALQDNQDEEPKPGVFWQSEGLNKWLLLKNGDQYVYNGKKYRWKGMVTMLRPYIWNKWTAFNNTFNNEVGIVQANVENGQQVSPRMKLVQSWNDFANNAGANFCMINSLYGYLSVQSVIGTYDGTFDPTFETLDDYLHFVFVNPGRTNEWDL